MPRPSPKTETRCCRSARWRQDPLLHFSSATTTSFARGIKSSNPPPSSGKSRANLIPRSGRRIFHRSPGERKIAHSANILSSEDRPTFAMNDYLPCGNLKINGSLVGSMTKAPAAQSQLSDQSQPLVAPPLPRSAGLLLFYEMIPLCLERGATGTRQGGGLRAARGRSSRSDDNARPLRLAGNRTPCRRDACRRPRVRPFDSRAKTVLATGSIAFSRRGTARGPAALVTQRRVSRSPVRSCILSAITRS